MSFGQECTPVIGFDALCHMREDVSRVLKDTFQRSFWRFNEHFLSFRKRWKVERKKSRAAQKKNATAPGSLYLRRGKLHGVPKTRTFPSRFGEVSARFG
jgi:hypothetical protein